MTSPKYLGKRLRNSTSVIEIANSICYDMCLVCSHSVTAWSSGTGAAGVLGAVVYSGLRQLDLSPRNTLFVMVIVPILEAIR